MMDFETYNELCYGIIEPDYPEEPDYDDGSEWDGWTDDEIREYLAQDRIDEMMLQAIIERGEAE